MFRAPPCHSSGDYNCINNNNNNNNNNKLQLGSHPVTVVQYTYTHRNIENGTKQTIHTIIIIIIIINFAVFLGFFPFCLLSSLLTPFLLVLFYIFTFPVTVFFPYSFITPLLSRLLPLSFHSSFLYWFLPPVISSFFSPFISLYRSPKTVR
jgi:hypothetical protein